MKPTDPGLEIYSAEWTQLVCDGIPPEWHPVLLDICQSYALGSSYDAQLLYYILRSHGLKVAGEE